METAGREKPTANMQEIREKAAKGNSSDKLPSGLNTISSLEDLKAGHPKHPSGNTANGQARPLEDQ